MDFWNLLLKNNAYLLIFSATGFIISLIWYVISERRRRLQTQSKHQLTDEASFFSQFEDLENPALKIPEFSSPTRTVLPHSVREQVKTPVEMPVIPEDSSHDENLRAEALKFQPAKTEEEPAEVQTDGSELQAQSESAPNYDEDEQKIKELLEQIKKDMREQGEHTS